MTDQAHQGDENLEFAIEQWVFELSLQIQAVDRIFDANRDDPRQQYGAYLSSLSLLTAALPDLPGFEAKFVALQDLAKRLQAMADGQKQALVPMAVKKGRPKFSFFDWDLIGRSSAAVEYLVRREFPVEIACEKVAAALHKHGVKARRGPISGATVMEWHEKVTAGLSSEAASAYERHLIMFTQLIREDIGRNELTNKIGVLVRPFSSPHLGRKKETF